MPLVADEVYNRAVPGDHYATLGVDKSATTEEIKLRHRHLVKIHSPDKHDALPKPQYDAKVAAWALINDAYHVLRDPDRRGQYDWEQAVLREEARAAEAARAPSPRAPSPRRPPGQHVRATLRVPLLTAIRGGSVRHGPLEIPIPRGTLTGLEIRVPSRGEPGSPPGDLLLTVYVDGSQILRRETHTEHNGRQVKLPAAHFHITAWASWAEAYGGGIIEIPTPWGPYRYEVDPKDPQRNLPDGLPLRVEGYGQRCNCQVPCRCPRGDLVVTFRLLPPDPGDAELKRILAILQPQDPRADLAKQMMESE